MRRSFPVVIPIRALLGGPGACVLLAVAGCADEREDEPSPAQLLGGGDQVVGYVVEDGAGPAPHGTWVRALNSFGAAIAGPPAQLQVDGMPVEVPLDTTGYGTLTVDQPGVAQITGGLGPATVIALDTDWSGFGLDPAHAAPVGGAEHAAAVTTGAVVAAGTALWWVGPEGRAHRVLEADGPITGLVARHVDVDEFLDVVAWTDLSVFVLRGRMHGGMAWGTALTAPGYSVGAVDVGDVNHDNLPDLVIGWAADEGPSKLDIHHGDGLYGFTPAVPRNLPAPPTGVSVGDNTGEGRVQITVLDTDGDWSRYIAGTPTKVIPIGPVRPDELVVPIGSTVDASGDLNGTGGDQIWIYGPRNPGSPRSIQLVDLKGQRLEYIPMSPPAPFLARGDGDGDGLLDLFMLHEDRSLHALAYSQVTLTYVPRKLADLAAYAPFAVAYWLDPRAVDLFLAADDLWRFHEATADPEDPTLFWRFAEPRLDTVGASVGPAIVVELDANPETTELLAFEEADGELRLAVQRWTPGNDAFERRGLVALSDVTDPPLDVAVCGSSAWILLTGELLRVSLANPAIPSVAVRHDTLATAVACGEGPEGAVAAALSEGAVQLLAVGGGEIGVVPAAGARNLALGAGELHTCATDGCDVAFWPWGDEGEASFVISDGAGALSLDDDAAGPFVGWGALSVADVDADGRLDLLAAGADGVVTILRSGGAAIAGPVHVHAPLGLIGPVGIGDGDGDGHGDLWLVDETGAIRHSRAPGSQPDEPERR